MSKRPHGQFRWAAVSECQGPRIEEYHGVHGMRAEKGTPWILVRHFERVAMMHDLSLAHLTVISLAPPQMVDVAARTGYRYVGLRLIAVTPDSPCYSLMHDQT